ATSYRMNPSSTNVGGWDASEMRKNTLATTIYGYLDTSIKSALRTVDKLASIENASSTILTSTDKLFLFSEIEIFGGITYSRAGEGEQYPYWKAGNSKMKYKNGSIFWWWERSPRAGISSCFAGVGVEGSAGSYAASDSGGVSFGFCV
ncbi:MAG: DUF6273 domain-containing protein, partial [Clostridia bacterium]